MTTETETTVDADRDDRVLPDLDLAFRGAWCGHRRYILDIAFRTLGDIGEAEDVVQEAYARPLGVDIDEIHDVRAWLVVVWETYLQPIGEARVDDTSGAQRRREARDEALRSVPRASGEGRAPSLAGPCPSPRRVGARVLRTRAFVGGWATGWRFG